MSRTRHTSATASQATRRKNKRMQTALSNLRRVGLGYGRFEGEGKRLRKKAASLMRIERKALRITGKVTKGKLQKRNTQVRDIIGWSLLR